MSGTNPFRQKAASGRDLNYAYAAVKNDLSTETAFPVLDTGRLEFSYTERSSETMAKNG